MAAPKLLSVVRNDFKEIYSVSADHIIKIYQGLYKIRKNMEWKYQKQKYLPQCHFVHNNL